MLKKAFLFLPFITLLVFWPALSGPTLLDDSIHLDPIIQWLSNRADTSALIFGNASGPFGRPISIISFVLNALSTGGHIWPMKMTNLVIHLLTGLCLMKLYFRLFKRDANLAGHAKLASLVAASLWLILPQHVATVFYLIQRMTLLATFFAVLACLLYVIARERMQANRGQSIALFCGVVALTALSILSKESGLLVPLYCLLIECLYFRPTLENPRPKMIAWGFRFCVIYPGILVIAYLALNPGVILDGYIDRPFSMPERALTQLHVMVDYFASTFVPMVRSSSVYNDDFPIVHGIGISEICILLAFCALIMMAIRLRESMPSFSAGIGLFFIGHLLESSIFSLEIYFSHRNYLPSIGLMLAAWGLFAGLAARHPTALVSIKRAVPLIFAGLFVAYGFAGFNRARIWSDNAALMAQAQIMHPASSRLRSELLLNSLYAKHLDLALQQADIALRNAPANEKRSIQLWRILAYCFAQAPMSDSELKALYAMPADRITIATSTALGYVSAAAEVNACPGLDSKQLGLLASQWAINTVQPAYSPSVWKAHFASARLLASGGDLKTGFEQAKQAFYDSGYNFDAGVLAMQLANSLDDRQGADEITTVLTDNMARYTELQQSQLRALRKQ